VNFTSQPSARAWTVARPTRRTSAGQLPPRSESCQTAFAVKPGRPNSPGLPAVDARRRVGRRLVVCRLFLQSVAALGAKFPTAALRFPLAHTTQFSVRIGELFLVHGLPPETDAPGLTLVRSSGLVGTLIPLFQLPLRIDVATCGENEKAWLRRRSVRSPGSFSVATRNLALAITRPLAVDVAAREKT